MTLPRSSCWWPQLSGTLDVPPQLEPLDPLLLSLCWKPFSRSPMFWSWTAKDDSSYYTESRKSKRRLSGTGFLFLSSQTSLKWKPSTKWSGFPFYCVYLLSPYILELLLFLANWKERRWMLTILPSFHIPLFACLSSYIQTISLLPETQLGIHHLECSSVGSSYRLRFWILNGEQRSRFSRSLQVLQGSVGKTGWLGASGTCVTDCLPGSLGEVARLRQCTEP